MLKENGVGEEMIFLEALIKSPRKELQGFNFLLTHKGGVFFDISLYKSR